MNQDYRENRLSNSSILYSNGSDEETSPLISIVIPAYCEQHNLLKLYAELVQALEAIDAAWEVIIVDDGSTDGTWREITALHEQNGRVKGLRLSRNFGHQYALFAGISHAAGRAVITMDADLQHPPTVIPQLLAHWYAGSKIVHTVRIDHPNTLWTKRVTSRIFYKIFAFLSGVELSSGMADYRLLDRQVVNELIHLNEGGLFLRGLIHWVGHSSSTVEFSCRERFSGQSKYDLWKMLKFAWTGLTSFSVVPLRMAIIVGLITSVIAFGGLLYAVVGKLFTNRAVPGWASVVAIESLLFGILFIMLGIIGEYIGRILEEVRGRPRFLIDEQMGFSTPATNLVTVQRGIVEQNGQT